jgi:type II secretory pathway component GspD/PulD (secretin)
VCVLVAALCAGRGPVAPTAAQTPPESVELSSQVEVARLVDLAAHRLQVSVEYDPALLPGSVTLRMAQSVGDDELWQLMHRVLAGRGLTTVRRTGTAAYSVVKIPDATGAAGIFDPAAPGPPPGFASVLVRLEYAPAKETAEAVRAVLSKGVGSASPVGPAAVLLTDLWPNLEQARALIAELDRPATPVVIRTYTARHLGASQLAALVTQVVAKLDKVAGAAFVGDFSVAPDGTGLLVVAPADRLEQWTSLLEQLDQREPVDTVTYPTGAFSLGEVARLIDQTVRGSSALAPADDRWRVVSDELSGALVITATPSQHARIAEVLARLDAVPADARRPVRTFPIRNRDVREVLAVLERLVASGALDAGPIGAPSAGPAAVEQRSEPGSSPSTIGAGAAAQRSDRVAQVGGQPVEPPGTSAAAGTAASTAPGVRGAPTRRAGAAGPVSAGSKPDVTLTADEGTSTIIAVGPARMLDQIAAILPKLDVRQPQVMVEVMLVTLSDSQQLDLGLELERLTSTGDTGIRLSSLFGLSSSAVVDGQRVRTVGDVPGFTGLVISPGEFSIVIRALESINASRSASRPKLLVNNNQQATFSSVLQQPYASTNASTTVATTSFGGTQDAGTTIAVRPQIAAGDNLLLDYAVALSSFVGASDSVSLPPPRQQNSVQSSATVPDGFVVAVGGLELDSSGESTDQVPFIAQVPVVGELFKNRSNTGGKTRFYVFIRASVMRHQDLADLKHLSQSTARAAGVDDGWPTVDPQVIR